WGKFSSCPIACPDELQAFFLQPQEGEDHIGQSLPDDNLLGILLRTLFHAAQRPGRSPSFLFQPQRVYVTSWFETNSKLKIGQNETEFWFILPPGFCREKHGEIRTESFMLLCAVAT
uniref:Uncharacterized protein n=1 Tax=Naja naja TaxID=35670 RepID=A0A8C6XF61_NAJNA